MWCEPVLQVGDEPVGLSVQLLDDDERDRTAATCEDLWIFKSVRLAGTVHLEARYAPASRRWSRRGEWALPLRWRPEERVYGVQFILIDGVSHPWVDTFVHGGTHPAEHVC